MSFARRLVLVVAAVAALLALAMCGVAALGTLYAMSHTAGAGPQYLVGPP